MTSAKSILSAWRIRAKKKLGQNFLSDPDTARKLVAAGGIRETDDVLEIGAGLGALTVPLAEKARRVIAVERDTGLLLPLKSALAASGAGNVHVLAADVLKLDFARIARSLPGRLTVAGNLPYNISSPVLIRLVEARSCISRAILMFQKELARRLLSPPGRKSYGRLTVLVQYCADVRKIYDLKAGAFFPKPRIDSSVLEIRFREPEPVRATDEELLFQLVGAAFGQRRKMLRNALGAGRVPVSAGLVMEGLAASRILPEQRAETLSVGDFVRLSNWIADRLPEKGGRRTA